MSDMHVLTVQQPWAWAIALGQKDVENRSWNTHYRGPVAIHAGKMVDAVAYEFAPMHRLLSECGIPVPRVPYTLERGAIVAVVDLVDVVPDSKSEWAMPGFHHWVLEKARRLTKPIPYRGGLGLLRLADGAVEQITKELGS